MSQTHNALTIDVEDYFQVSAMDQAVSRDQWDRWPSRVERNTHRLLELFERRSVTATFFVLGWVAQRYPGLIRAIADAGHEVASHGMSHELVYRQTRACFREETHRSKSILEDTAQQPVRGYRAASYSITRDSLWALDILVELGFAYDSSVFPIHHDRYGIADFSRWPVEVSAPSGGTLIEVPLTTWRLAHQNLPIAGGGYFRLYPYWLSRLGLRRVNREKDQPFVFYLHPWEIDPDQPRVSGLPMRSRVRHYLNLARTEPRLDRLLGDFPFTSLHQMLLEQGLSPDAYPQAPVQAA